MNSRPIVAALVGASLIGIAQNGLAFDMGNMMNPSKWMDGDRQADRGRGWDGPGYGAPGGYGMPGWSGMPYGQGGPGGYNMPGAYGGPTGYGAPMGYPGPGVYGPQRGYGGPSGPTQPAMPGYPGTPAPGMAPPIAAPAAPSGVYGTPPAGSSEIEALKARVRELEGRVGR
ncbi:hypothetical protein [Thiorhodococcus minor]|uniref:Uncharacterized protein n=1 Tax=Thiorhodococcus minor TaxID=57489 RepID=A0A6M0K2V8_9GAMM|nr:hypothetical protein [Thiorhodococcus minor]NEV64102.1 hypothetical protein [Thiorhodococcus minor]